MEGQFHNQRENGRDYYIDANLTKGGGQIIAKPVTMAKDPKY